MYSPNFGIYYAFLGCADFISATKYATIAIPTPSPWA